LVENSQGHRRKPIHHMGTYMEKNLYFILSRRETESGHTLKGEAWVMGKSRLNPSGKENGIGKNFKLYTMTELGYETKKRGRCTAMASRIRKGFAS